jgi:hypothetical protein
MEEWPHSIRDGPFSPRAYEDSFPMDGVVAQIFKGPVRPPNRPYPQQAEVQIKPTCESITSEFN